MHYWSCLSLCMPAGLISTRIWLWLAENVLKSYFPLFLSLFLCKHSYLDRETSLLLRNIAGKPSHLLTKVMKLALLSAWSPPPLQLCYANCEMDKWPLGAVQPSQTCPDLFFLLYVPKDKCPLSVSYTLTKILPQSLMARGLYLWHYLVIWHVYYFYTRGNL